MVEGYLKEVLIKECGDMLHDKVIVVENLPKRLLYEETIKMVPHVDRDGYKDGTMVPDPKGEMVETLKPGIEKSLNGDDGFLFWKGNQESQERLKDIDRYIDGTLPRDIRPPSRIPYAQQVGNTASNPIQYRNIPRIVLSVPDERVGQEKEKQDLRSIMTEARLEKLRSSLKKAREVRLAKKAAAV